MTHPDILRDREKSYQDIVNLEHGEGKLPKFHGAFSTACPTIQKLQGIFQKCFDFLRINESMLATLSVGWTTRYSSEETGEYTEEMVNEMVSTLEKNNISQPVTFPIRAAFVGKSLESLEWLLDAVPDSTITVWSSETDKIDVFDLVTLRENVGQDAVYYDLPEDQMKEFEEAKNSHGNNAAVGFQLLPKTLSLWMTVGIAALSALAGLYFYD